MLYDTNFMYDLLEVQDNTSMVHGFMQFAPLLIVVRLTLTLTWTIRTYYVDLSYHGLLVPYGLFVPLHFPKSP